MPAEKSRSPSEVPIRHLQCAHRTRHSFQRNEIRHIEMAGRDPLTLSVAQRLLEFIMTDPPRFSVSHDPSRTVPLQNEKTGEKVQIVQPPLHHFMLLDFFVHRRRAFVVESATKDLPEVQRGAVHLVRACNSSAVKVQWLCG